MIVLISEKIEKAELEPLAKFFTLGDIKRACLKVRSSGVELGNLGYANCKILKVRLGSKPAGRMIVFILMDSGVCVPIVIRLKKDKVFGENLATSNKKAKEIIMKNITAAFEDIESGSYREVVV